MLEASRTIAIRREVVAAYVGVVNEKPARRGLVNIFRKRMMESQPGTQVATELQMHFQLLPHERQFRMDAATLRRKHNSGELLQDRIPDESSMVTFLGLCYVASEYYKGLLNRRPYQTPLQVSA